MKILKCFSRIVWGSSRLTFLHHMLCKLKWVYVCMAVMFFSLFFLLAFKTVTLESWARNRGLFTTQAKSPIIKMTDYCNIFICISDQKGLSIWWNPCYGSISQSIFTTVHLYHHCCLFRDWIVFSFSGIFKSNCMCNSNLDHAAWKCL